MRAFMILFALLLTACSRPAMDDGAGTDADPALWVVEDDDTTIYLFGTIHFLQPGLTWFDDAVRKAFDESDSLVLELVSPEPSEMAVVLRDLAIATDGKTLSERLSPEYREKLAERLDEYGIAPATIEPVEPWYAAVLLALAPVQQSALSRDEGVETVLAAAAGEQAKPVIGLETAREQLSYFDGLSPEAQITLLEQTLDGLASFDAQLQEMLGAWRSGDADRLGTLVNSDINTLPELGDVLLLARNVRWAEWIDQRLEQPGTVFMAVGAGHLAGPKSVQEALAEQGIETRRIRY